MARITPDMAAVEREVGELPGSVREALLAFCEGRPVRNVAALVFGKRSAAAEVDAMLARLDALSFEGL